MGCREGKNGRLSIDYQIGPWFVGDVGRDEISEASGIPATTIARVLREQPCVDTYGGTVMILSFLFPRHCGVISVLSMRLDGPLWPAVLLTVVALLIQARRTIESP